MIPTFNTWAVYIQHSCLLGTYVGGICVAISPAEGSEVGGEGCGGGREGGRRGVEKGEVGER